MSPLAKVANGTALTVARPGAERDVIRIDAAKQDTPTLLRTAAYARVSTELEKQQTSYAAQVLHYTQLITQNPKWQFVDVYADEGITGTSTAKRDGFKRLMADCRKGKIDRILTKSISRFCRNTLDSIRAVRELTSLGVSICFEKEAIDTATMRGELMLTVMSDFAQHESLSIAGNLRRGLRMRMANGDYVTPNAPLGYRMENRQLVIDKSEAATVRWIFKQYLAGIGSDRIALALTMVGVPRKDGETHWSKGSILYVLQNERYVGDALYQKSYTSDTLPYRKIINHGELDRYYYTDAHPPIVSRETFQRAQELLERRRQKRGQLPEWKQYPFTKILRCGECGRAYRHKVTNGKPYWVCRRHDQDKTLCGGPRLPEQALQSAFVRLYNKLKLHRKSLLGILLEQLYAIRRSIHLDNPRVIELNENISRCFEQNRVLIGLVAKGYMDSALFHAKKQENEAEILRMKDELGRISDTAELDIRIDSTKELLSVLEDGPARLNAFDAALFSDLVEKMVVESQNQVVFCLHNGLTLAETMEVEVRK